jgi:glycosyltransferase involved in cell wall biosynthesis
VAVDRMTSDRPPVTIGMPTRNGSRFIARSIESLLAQDYPNWRLVISDNASDDGTEAIARSYAERSVRISYDRSAENLGMSGNFNRALALADGRYFIWAADHDLWDPTLISRCVAALEARPDAVLACPGSFLIDESDAVISEMDDQIELDLPSALARYKRLIWRLAVCNMVYGVIRRDALLATPGFTDVHGMDHALLAALVLQGPFLRVGGHLFLRRRNRPVESPSEHRLRALADIDQATAADRAAQATGRLYRPLRELHVRVVRRSGLSALEKLDAVLATHDCFQQRFEVPSTAMKVLRTGARALRVRGPFDRHFGAGD